jgi:hypothetical protein
MSSVNQIADSIISIGYYNKFEYVLLNRIFERMVLRELSIIICYLFKMKKLISEYFTHTVLLHDPDQMPILKANSCYRQAAPAREVLANPKGESGSFG